MSLVFDSFALIALFQKEKGYEEVIDWLSTISPENPGFMSMINLGEVYYMTCRKQSIEKAELALQSSLQLQLTFVDADFNLTYKAAKLKSRYKFSYADAFAAALTIEKKGTLITGDPEFESLLKEKDFKVHFINRSK
jgi:PIN domain nuclease of toxin-antitoxin system